jgi:hypothetical protein
MAREPRSLLAALFDWKAMAVKLKHFLAFTIRHIVAGYFDECIGDYWLIDGTR